MYKRAILSLLLFTFQMHGFCQNLHKDSIHVDYIEFGKGGGFTGERQSYMLTKTGELYRIQNTLTEPDSLTYIKKIKPCTAKKIFCYAKKKKILELTYNEPGNMYHYIDVSVNAKKKKFVWESSDCAAPEHIVTLSTKLYNLL